MKGYFVSHPLEKSGDIPGRYPLMSKVVAIDVNNNTLEDEVYIFGDSYGKNEMAPNMDPCIFSDPLPWCWAYCRMTSRGSRQPNHNVIVDGRCLPTVVTTSRLLNKEVNKGDIIFFGYYSFYGSEISQITIDTVFVVESKEKWKVKLPKTGKKVELVEPPRRNDFTENSDIWKFQFEDHKYGHKYINVDNRYYSFFGKMYSANTKGFYSYLPWVSNENMLSLTGNELYEPHIKEFCSILEDSRIRVKQYDKNDLRRPIQIDFDLAKNLWNVVGVKSKLRIIKAKPDNSIKMFKR